MNNIKSKLWILVLISAIVLIVTIGGTYALFENNGTGATDIRVGKWVIKLNTIDISPGITQTFNINDITYTENTNLANGYIAPGRSGYVDILGDPAGTEVAVRYDITFNCEENNYPENISFSVQDLSGGNAIKT